MIMEFLLPLPHVDDHTSTSLGNWKHMKQRFKDCLILKHADQKSHDSDAVVSSTSFLMYISRNKIHDILKAFSSGVDHKASAIDDMFENIEDICLPHFILLYERFKFFSFKQKQLGDFQKFFSELQMLGGYCEFQEHHNKYVTSRIVDGIYSEALRTHLQDVPDLELEKAVEICNEADASSFDSCGNVVHREMRNPRDDKSKFNDVDDSKGSNIVTVTVNAQSRVESCSIDDSENSNKPTVIDNIRSRGKSCIIDENNSSKKSVVTKNVQSRGGKSKQTKRRCLVAGSRRDIGSKTSRQNSLASPVPTPSLRQTRSISRVIYDTQSSKTLSRKSYIKSLSTISMSEITHNKSFISKNCSNSVGKMSCKPDNSPSLSSHIEMNNSEIARQERNVCVSFVHEEIASMDHVKELKMPQLWPKEEVCMKDIHVNCISAEDIKPGFEVQRQDETTLDGNSQHIEPKKLRKCPICGLFFATSYLLKCHSRIHSGQMLYKCSICDMGFIHCGSRSRHMRQSHPELLKFPCDECDMLFERQKALDQHKLSHSKEEDVSCEDCGVFFMSTRELYQHRRREHRNIRYNCDKCGLHFPYPSKLKLHLMSKHNATKPFMCEICGSSFAERNMLSTHKNIHSGEKKHECPICSRMFLLKTTLSNHIQTHLDHKPHTCGVCGMSFKLSYYLKSHMKTHSQNRERPHICSKCGAAFLKLAQLRNHERKHTGEKPYKCEVCSSLFSQLSSLKKHIKQIHEGLKPKDRFSCEYCGLAFTHSCKLKLHLMKHTGERPFVCKICGSTYRENHQLTTHMKTHSSSEPFKCPICTRRFLQKSSLEGHVRTHTGEKPFKCSICCQHFSHKGYLRDHLKVHDQNRERKYKCSICNKAFTCSSHMRSHERLHSGEKPHKCDLCGSRFTKRSSVKKHLRRTHGIHEGTVVHVQDSAAVQSIQGTATVTLSQLHPVDATSQGIHPELHQGFYPPQIHQVIHQEHQTGHPKKTHQDINSELQTESHQGMHPKHDTQTHQSLHLHHPQARHGIYPECQPEIHQDIQHQAHQQAHPTIHTELHLGLASKLRPVVHDGIAVQLHSTHNCSDVRPDTHSDLQSQPQHGMCARLHTLHTSSQHLMHQHPSIHIIHTDAHSGLHSSTHAKMEPQINPAISVSLGSQLHHRDIVQEMHVYTLAS